MAEKPKLPKGPPRVSINEDVEKKACWHIEEARKHKAQWELDMREAYFFCAPHRSRSVSSRQAVGTRPQDAGEANTSFPFEMATDFATTIINTFMPEADPWAGRQPALGTPQAVIDEVKDQLKTDDQTIFTAISASNFYSECGVGFDPDLALGTVAMWIDDSRPLEGFQCQAIPIHELEISTGPNGHVDARFFIQHTRYSELKALVPEVTSWPKEIQDKMNKDYGKHKCELRRGFWRDWSEMNDIKWQYVIMVGEVLIEEKTVSGRGSCPLMVGRFGPSKEWAWAAGPAIKCLPDYRALDELAGAKIENCDLTLRPPIAIPDDSVVNFEEGIEAGMAYPIRPGSEGALKQLYEASQPNVAIYDRSDTEQRIKRIHFLDYPDQAGKTPPSATQWLDQMTMAQRRIGTPGAVFWREFCAEVFLRFEYMCLKRGLIKKTQAAKVGPDGKDNGDKALVSLMPINPAHKASEQQEVAQAARVIQICGEAFPEEWKMSVDGTKTIKNITDKAGADKIIAMRDPDQIQAAVKNIAALAGGQVPGAPQGAVNAGQQAPAANPAGPAPQQAETQLQNRVTSGAGGGA